LFLTDHGNFSPDRQVDGRASAEKSKESIETAMAEWCLLLRVDAPANRRREFSADVLLTRMERKGKMILQATVRDITERKRAEEKTNEE